MSTPIALSVVPVQGSADEWRPLPLTEPGSSCAFRLRCLPGATALHVVLAAAGQPRLRAEVPANPGELVTVHVVWLSNGDLNVSSAHRDVLRLPPDARYAPAPLLDTRTPREAVDVALLVDGTSTRYAWQAEGVRRWVQVAIEEQQAAQAGQPGRAAWPAHLQELHRFVARLAESWADCRVAVTAFGDHCPVGLGAQDLLPRYDLYPRSADDRALLPFDPQRLHDELAAIPPTSGADYVDALAEGLQACARLHWRDDARKVVLVSGQSPGHSLVRPAPRGADADVRQRDVESQLARLHAAGVEVVSVFHGLPNEQDLVTEEQRELARFARAHYARLASLQQYAWDVAGFDGAGAAGAVAGYAGLIARNAAPGEFAGVVAPVRQC